MAELRDVQHHSHTVVTIGEKSVPSDHIPVRLAIWSLPKGQMDYPVIRRWLTQNPLFVNLLDVEHRNMMSTLSSHSTSSRMLHAVLARPQQAILVNSPTTLGIKLLVSYTDSRAMFIAKSSEVHEGHIFRALETLHSLTLCNCDCKIITAAICFDLRRYSIRVHGQVQQHYCPAGFAYVALVVIVVSWDHDEPREVSVVVWDLNDRVHEL